MTQKMAIGIDIGGTNTQFGLVDARGNLVARGSMPTGKEEVEGFLDRLQEALSPWMVEKARGNIMGIGLGAPNAQPYSGEVLEAANLSWKGNVPLREMLSRRFGLPVFLQNDANAAAWGEHLFGRRGRYRHFVLLTLGTGLGSGIIQDGRLLLGNHGLAGELGHWIVEPDGRPCGCGRRGCLERYVSATGLVDTARLWLDSRSIPTVLREGDEPITALRIARGAQSGDEFCLELFDYTARILARAMANLVACLSPEAIILFGGLAESGPCLFDPLEEQFQKDLLYLYKGKVEILASALPAGDAAILGAAALVWHSPA